MVSFRILLPALLSLMSGHVSADERLDGLLKNLESDSFEVREKATKDLVAYDISIDKVRALLEAVDLPESRKRLNAVINGKYEAIGWIRFQAKDVVEQATPCGSEADGGILYLAKTTYQGGDLIGKYQTSWGAANFPVGEAEMLIGDFSIWIGEGKWKTWKKGMKGMIAMGLGKDGKVIYACRAKLNGGLHPGTLFEGDDHASISWGEKVQHPQEFEVLVQK